jgi:cytochrome b561
VIMVVALGHAVLALIHQYVLKDGTLVRMMRAR